MSHKKKFSNLNMTITALFDRLDPVSVPENSKSLHVPSLTFLRFSFQG